MRRIRAILISALLTLGALAPVMITSAGTAQADQAPAIYYHV